jgi:hypothetical protein
MIGRMPGATMILGIAQTTSDLVPYVALLVVGFLVGAWGQSAKFPIAVAIGLLLIMAAVGGFILDNDSGSCGIPAAC